MLQIFYQFHAQKALFKGPKSESFHTLRKQGHFWAKEQPIRTCVFWLENLCQPDSRQPETKRD